MATRLVQINMKAQDDAVLGRFWAEALGWGVDSEGPGAPVAVCIDIVARPEPKTVKNRVHLDVRPYPGDDLAAEEARLRALGATDPGIDQSAIPWTVLADPEGNEFCLLTPR